MALRRPEAPAIGSGPRYDAGMENSRTGENRPMSILPRHLATAALLLLLLPCISLAQSQRTEKHDIRVESLAEGLAHPWAVAFLPDGRMLVTERPGRLLLIDIDRDARKHIDGLPDIAATGQGGLLDVVLHPRYKETGWIYLSYAAPGSGGSTTAVGRGRIRGDRLVDFEEIFRAEPAVRGGRHFGSRMVFDRDEYLYISIGDRGERDRAQDTADHIGTVIRLHDDGATPDDNPFAVDGTGRPEIYTYGHRNPQGMILHPERAEIWIHEHGPRGGDELNILQRGENYGWPKMTHGREYHGPEIGPSQLPGMQPPIHHWTPSIAPSEMAYYDGGAFPRWRGNLFVGALAHTHLARLEMDADTVAAEERLLDEFGWRIRDVRQGSDGLLYLLVDSGNGALLRVRPAN